MSEMARGRREVALQLGLAGAALLLAWLFGPEAHRLPPCGFHAVTGYWCPGCGGTRMLSALAEGRLTAALRYNPLLFMLLPLLLGYWLGTLRARWRGDRPPVIPSGWLWTAGAAVLLFWILRNIPHWPFELLAPG